MTDVTILSSIRHTQSDHSMSNMPHSAVVCHVLISRTNNGKCTNHLFLHYVSFRPRVHSISWRLPDIFIILHLTVLHSFFLFRPFNLEPTCSVHLGVFNNVDISGLGAIWRQVFTGCDSMRSTGGSQWTTGLAFHIHTCSTEVRCGPSSPKSTHMNHNPWPQLGSFQLLSPDCPQANRSFTLSELACWRHGIIHWGWQWGYLCFHILTHLFFTCSRQICNSVGWLWYMRCSEKAQSHFVCPCTCCSASAFRLHKHTTYPRIKYFASNTALDATG